jgi:hypothetical protein
LRGGRVGRWHRLPGRAGEGGRRDGVAGIDGLDAPKRPTNQGAHMQAGKKAEEPNVEAPPRISRRWSRGFIILSTACNQSHRAWISPHFELHKSELGCFVCTGGGTLSVGRIQWFTNRSSSALRSNVIGCWSRLRVTRWPGVVRVTGDCPSMYEHYAA